MIIKLRGNLTWHFVKRLITFFSEKKNNVHIVLLELMIFLFKYYYFTMKIAFVLFGCGLMLV